MTDGFSSVLGEGRGHSGVAHVRDALAAGDIDRASAALARLASNAVRDGLAEELADQYVPVLLDRHGQMLRRGLAACLVTPDTASDVAVDLSDGTMHYWPAGRRHPNVGWVKAPERISVACEAGRYLTRWSRAGRGVWAQAARDPQLLPGRLCDRCQPPADSSAATERPWHWGLLDNEKAGDRMVAQVHRSARRAAVRAAATGHDAGLAVAGAALDVIVGGAAVHGARSRSLLPRVFAGRGRAGEGTLGGRCGQAAAVALLAAHLRAAVTDRRMYTPTVADERSRARTRARALAEDVGALLADETTQGPPSEWTLGIGGGDTHSFAWDDPWPGAAA